jgi:acyl carrier protein
VKTEPQIRAHLASWVAERSKSAHPEEISGDTAILEQRLITSLQLMELILEIEGMSGKAVDFSRLRPGDFRDIDTIYKKFFAGRLT